MIQFDGWNFPEGEAHLQEWMRAVDDRRDGRLLYQGAKYRAALALTRHRRHAVDVGAHVGLWSWQMAGDFDRVTAFEPIDAHRDCWRANLAGRSPRARIYAAALGARRGRVALETGPASSGDTRVVGEGDLPLYRLDDFELTEVDLLKIDCEGYELFVLRGAVETLRRCRPAVIVEQKEGHAQRYGLPETAAVDFLVSLGAVRRGGMQGDFLLSWPDAAG